MPIVVAGDKAKFITGYTPDGNSQVDFGKNVWLAQSFPLAALYHLFRCPFKFWDNDAGHVKYFALRHALADGTPTGANIAESHKAAQQDSKNSPGTWLLIDFDSFPLLTAGNYALLAYVPDAHFTTSQHISAQSTPRLYANGKAFRSTDSGATWTEIPNTNLLFQIWGYQPPPAPPPPDAIGNWYQTNLTYILTASGYRIITTTNIPVHQFLRWTITPPQKHVKPVIMRGTVAGTYIDQCFVVYYDIEQVEPGDTFTHTFIAEPWPVCQTRYFYFWATKLAQLMPSASPIYEKHRTAPTYTPICYSTPNPGNSRWSPSYCTHGSYAIRPCATFTPNKLSFWLDQWGGWPFPPTLCAAIWTSNANAMPLVELANSGWLPVTPPGPVATKFEFPITGCPQLLSGGLYAIVIKFPTRPTGSSYWARLCMQNATDTCPHPCSSGTRCYYREGYPYSFAPCTTDTKPWLPAYYLNYSYELGGTLP